jgi:hypothetical protein
VVCIRRFCLHSVESDRFRAKMPFPYICSISGSLSVSISISRSGTRPCFFSHQSHPPSHLYTPSRTNPTAAYTPTRTHSHTLTHSFTHTYTPDTLEYVPSLCSRFSSYLPYSASIVNDLCEAMTEFNPFVTQLNLPPQDPRSRQTTVLAQSDVFFRAINLVTNSSGAPLVIPLQEAVPKPRWYAEWCVCVCVCVGVWVYVV